MNRKTRKFLEGIFFVAVIAILTWVASFSVEVRQPLFSHESGFYEEGFYLTINVPKGCAVYYTIDGSVPDDDSAIYKEPLFIEPVAEEEPCRYANIEDVSGFEALGWQDKAYIPVNSIKRASVISARTKDIHGKWSETVVKTYFIGISQAEYNNLPIVALTIDPNGLFGENGIYTNGKEYGELIKNYAVPLGGDAEKIVAAQKIWKTANWAQRGKEWKRDADFTFFFEDQMYSAKAKVNISGGMSRIYYQKSFVVSFLELFENSLIKGIDSYGSVKLRQGGSQNLEEFLNDYIVQKLSDSSAFDVQKQQPCILFLDGEYWGIYTICEKYTEEYFRAHYGINTNNILLLKSVGSVQPEVEIGQEKDIKLYNDFMGYVEKTDFSHSDNYNELMTKMDMDSFVQLYCTNIYFGNLDMVNHNAACWTYLDEAKGEYAKWKWMMYDCDSTFTSGYALHDVIELYRQNDVLFCKLMENEEFKKKVVSCFEELRNTKLNPVRTEAVISETEELLLPIIGEYYDRFGPAEIAHKTEKEQEKYFIGYMNRMKDFLQNRYETCLNEVYHYFDLDIYDLKEKDILIDFSENGNAEYFIESGFYGAEEDGRYVQKRAEISIQLAPCNGVAIDLSGNVFAEKTKIRFNERVIWSSSDGEKSLSGIIVPKEAIVENGKNIISISTDKEILSAKQRGLSEDERILAHYMTKMKVTELQLYDINEKNLIIDFTKDGNADSFTKKGFYDAEEDGSWARKEAEVIVYLAACNGLKLDMSKNTFYEDAMILFNGKIAWKTEDGVEALANIEIPGEWINENAENIISISAESNVLSPKEAGTGEDERILAHRISKICISGLK